MAIITIKLTAPNIADLTALYDRLEVWRSTTENGTYVNLTADTDTRAIVNGTVAGTWNLAGKALSVSLSGSSPFTTSFSENALDLLSVLKLINTTKNGLAAETGTDTNKIAILSPLVGTGASILISGTAAATFGLSTTKVNGKNIRMKLSDTTTTYAFKDYDGSKTYWYKTRFYSSTTTAASEFSTPRLGGIVNALNPGDLSLATVTIISGNGNPIPNRRIYFYPSETLAINGNTLTPNLDNISITTDISGYAETSLIRGITYKVAIEGSAYTREFEVPNQDTFDLFEVMSTRPDPFSIVQTPPMPIRVS